VLSDVVKRPVYNQISNHLLYTMTYGEERDDLCMYSFTHYCNEEIIIVTTPTICVVRSDNLHDQRREAKRKREAQQQALLTSGLPNRLHKPTVIVIGEGL